jgi:hypothetical protein
MKPEQFEKALRGFLRRRPFRPFLIELVSGDKLRVTHPEAIELRGELWVLVAGPGQRYRVFTAAVVCQLLDLPEPAGA